jgi:AhpD family alkylhydroperoxidase
MAKDYKAITSDIAQYLQQLSSLSPDVMASFGAISKSATETRILDAKTKELIALAVAVSVRCDGCIGFHAKKARALGITREELAEALSVSIAMGGGPSAMYATDALRAFDQFADQA